MSHFVESWETFSSEISLKSTYSGGTDLGVNARPYNLKSAKEKW
jgi:hypothetical protein